MQTAHAATVAVGHGAKVLLMHVPIAAAAAETPPAWMLLPLGHG